ncbi:MAG: orotidine-5'-phosphate decarboxylase [Ezakiella sp.]|nr:orotidine-5'-phosphate decarboxylase [Ezakiella sp.]MDD7471486.1 orotidine-5'-phosphate decarboxylase [Bacillota bacterium]MDY3923688.1 orotidine-5'-phosphate decarboxylase [Ezakiella sp.]
MSIDKLYESVKDKGPVCVGLDPNLQHIPEIFDNYSSIEDKLFFYNKAIIDSTYDLTACYKPQLAYYEALGIDGLKALKRTNEYIRNKGGLIINDAKRGDISTTASAYARAFFEGDLEGDILTLSPYMGLDSIEPYLEYIDSKDKGVFVIIKTSNKGSADFEEIDVNGEPLYAIVGKKIVNMNGNSVGKHGYRKIGFVIGATNKKENEGEYIRNLFKDTFFLIPGYGAQGGAAKDVMGLLVDGNGGVVNSSRGIIRAFEKSEKDFDIATREAVIKMREDFYVGL